MDRINVWFDPYSHFPIGRRVVEMILGRWNPAMTMSVAASHYKGKYVVFDGLQPRNAYLRSKRKGGNDGVSMAR